jgi:hypothetical protein
VFRGLYAKRVDFLLGGSNHESNGRTKRIKLDLLVNIRNKSVFFKYPQLKIDLVAIIIEIDFFMCFLS